MSNRVSNCLSFRQAQNDEIAYRKASHHRSSPLFPRSVPAVTGPRGRGAWAGLRRSRLLLQLAPNPPQRTLTSKELAVDRPRSRLARLLATDLRLRRRMRAADVAVRRAEHTHCQGGWLDRDRQ